MKNFTKYISIMLFGMFFILWGCQEDDYKLGELVTPGNVEVSFSVLGVDNDNPYGDGSGKVEFTATASNEMSYTYIFGDGSDKVVDADGKVSHVFTKTGVNKYTVTVMAVGTGGLSATKSVQVEVFSSFSDPEAEQFLTGGSSKKWYWAADQPGHVGLGPNTVDGTNHTFAQWWSAGPFEKSCMYDAEFEFTKTAEGVTFEQKLGTAYVPGTYAGKIGVEGDACHGEDVTPKIYGVKNMSFAPANTIATKDGGYRGTSFTIGDGGFMCWWVGTSTYEIIQVTDNILKVRVEEDGTFAWYHTFTSVKPGSESSVDVTYTNLVWSDEFDTNGAPDAAKWGYDLGTGNNGWGNNEAQTYTNDAANVVIEDGNLKIKAIKDGSSYTSARIKTEGLYEFQYGRIDVRAKLPKGGGTWPAIWMLGANFSTAGWPACGEIDIMEATGNNPGKIHGSIHNLASSGSTVNTKITDVADAADEFHVYSVNWSANEISFLIDDEIFYTYSPDDKNNENWPFDAKQFIILNLAMGGTMGGAIDAAFTDATFEIDYVRVYQ
ncbi:glycosyl hydrolase family protein [Prolixibacteraceae bacterium JC049]|nr:glycosyl hydrolase family protein [Prolixibacteraceae bacterium JC049]